MARRLPLIVLLLFVGVSVYAATALAAPPANDQLADATEITNLPFADSVDITEATEASGEGGCGPPRHTVWYRFTPARAAVLRIKVTTTTFMPSAGLWSGGTPPVGNVACGDPGGNLIAEVSAGQTYYLQLGTRFMFDAGGPLQLSITEIPPPANDDFADATAVSPVPFSDAGELTAATLEPGEPRPSSSYASPSSIWYRLGASTAQRISISGTGIAVAAYTGTDLESLALVDYREVAYGVPLTLQLEPGTDIHLQVLKQFGGFGGGYWPFTVSVVETPPPNVDFSAYPSDPSVFEDVYFYDGSSDPVAIGIASYRWTFGDGATSTLPNPAHRFGADGDYDVTLSVTTADGRTSARTKTLSVRTHDVGILWFSTPGRGRIGRVSPIEVGIGNTRNAETVQVDLYKSTATGWWEFVGSVTKSVPKLGKNKTVVFSVPYLFTEADLALGKVSFQAIATVAGVREAFPADNQAISTPTLVVR